MAKIQMQREFIGCRTTGGWNFHGHGGCSGLLRHPDLRQNDVTGHDGRDSSKAAFTLTELVVAILVITMVVVITLPITIKKMSKVDSISYYMSYTLMKDIMSNLYEKMSAEDDCAFTLNGTCYGTPFEATTALSYAECEEVKDSLGISACSYDTDYWAGAVQACGGRENLPSQEQLTELAEYLYGTTINSSTTYGTLDTDKAASLGFTLNSSGNFYVWSSQEASSSSVYFRDFRSTYTSWYSNLRNVSGKQAVCVDLSYSLCDGIKGMYNISSSACSESKSKVVTAGNSGDFSSLTPHIVLSNGLQLYIMDKDDIDILSDSTDEDDRTGYTVYVDMSGKKGGKSKLYEDVFPFYLLMSGKVVPGYSDNAGAATSEHLSLSVIYDTYSGGNRAENLLVTGADFKTAACKAGYVTSSKYCGSITKDTKCSTTESDCRFKIYKPVRIF